MQKLVITTYTLLMVCGHSGATSLYSVIYSKCQRLIDAADSSGFSHLIVAPIIFTRDIVDFLIGDSIRNALDSIGRGLSGILLSSSFTDNMSLLTESLRTADEYIMTRLRPFIAQFSAKYPESGKLLGESVLDVVLFLIWCWLVIQLILILVQAGTRAIRRKSTKKSFKGPKQVLQTCDTPLRPLKGQLME